MTTKEEAMRHANEALTSAIGRFKKRFPEAFTRKAQDAVAAPGKPIIEPLCAHQKQSVTHFSNETWIQQCESCGLVMKSGTYVNDNGVITQEWVGLSAEQIASIPNNEYKLQTAERLLRENNSATQPDMNLNCKSVQARLATSWGYVKAQQDPIKYLVEAICTKCGATESGVLTFKEITQPMSILKEEK